MMPIEFATHRRINKVWTVVFRRHGNEVEILAHDNAMDCGYEYEHGVPHYVLVEDDDRTALELVLSKGDYWRKDGVKVDEERLKVLNPKHVFDYPKTCGDLS